MNLYPQAAIQSQFKLLYEEATIFNGDSFTPILSLSEYVYEPSLQNYNEMVNTLDATIAKIEMIIPTSRLLFCTASGHVLYDSYAVDADGESTNKFTNINKVELTNDKLKYVINEPHGIRSYVQLSMNSENGKAEQILYSNTTKERRFYHCERVGDISNPVGILVLSFVF